jgi:hypothetical protein
MSKLYVRLLVLERDVQGKNVGILNSFRHVGMSGPVVHDQTPDELSVGVRLVLHLHDLDHVQVNGVFPSVGTGLSGLDGKNGINDVCAELLSEGGVEFGGKGSVSDGDEVCAVEGGCLSERVEELI